MAGVWMWVRRDARRRARALLGIALLVAVASAVVLATVAGGRRNGSAFSRLFEKSAAAEVMVLPNTPGFDWNEIRKLPYVETVGEFDLAGYGTYGSKLPDQAGGFAPASPELYTQVEHGVVVDGRTADPTRAGEVVMTPAAKAYGLGVGSHVKLETWKPATVKRAAEMPQPPLPDGPIVDATIVGVVKAPFFIAYGADSGGVVPTHAFYQRYHNNLLPYIGVEVHNALLRLRGGYAHLPQLARVVDRVAGHPVEITRADEITKPARHAASLERTALFGFALAAALAALVLIGQAVIRMVAAGAGDMPVLQSMGLTRSQETVALTIPTATAGIVGAVLGIGLAYAGSDRFPIGIGRKLEPSPGWHADWLVFGAGVAVTIVLVLYGVASAAAWYVWRGYDARSTRRSAIARTVRNAGAPVPLALGTQLALERTPGRGSVPVKPALIGAVAGIIGIVGALTFRTGLDRAASDRMLYGQQFQAGVEGATPTEIPPRVVKRIVSDPDVQDVNATTISVVVVNNKPITLFGIDPLKGATDIVTTKGHSPSKPDEILLAPVEASTLHVHVGDTVKVGSASRPFKLVGIGFTPVSSHTTYDQAGWIPAAGLRAADPTNADRKYYSLAVAFRPGANVDAAIDKLNHPDNIGLSAIDLPAPFFYLRNVRTIPVVLGAFLVLLAIAAIGHALASMVGRRRREIAVLRSIGLTRGQVRASVAWQATTLAIVGLVFGVPLGVLVGRAVWRNVAEATPLQYVPPFSLVVVLLVVPLALLLCNALAAWPARRAARLRAAEVLRTE
jgi:ABC-type lipoprotein release transport system permease subunit